MKKKIQCILSILVIKNKNKDLSTYEEGCLSVPNQFAEVDRPATCEVEYLDYYGEKNIKSKWFISNMHTT